MRSVDGVSSRRILHKKKAKSSEEFTSAFVSTTIRTLLSRIINFG